VRSVLDMHSGIPGDIDNGLISEGRPYPGYRDFLLRALGARRAATPAEASRTGVLEAPVHMPAMPGHKSPANGRDGADRRRHTG